MKRFFLILLFAAAWCAVFIPWTGFMDPDAFYHAKSAALIWQSGPIKTFPWLDLTLLGSHYADLHFGFHLFVAPFAHVLGMLTGLRVATALLAAFAVATFEACLRWLRIRRAWFWTAALLVSQPFVFRLLLGKATPLATIWYFFGLTAAWKRRPLLVAIVTTAFAFSYGGWMYLTGSIALLAIGDLVYAHLVEGRQWKKAFASSMWREILASIAGAAAGLVLHPNFPDVLRFSWAQIVTIGLGTPFQHVVLGTEWLPAELPSLLSSLAPWVIAFVLGLMGLALALRDDILPLGDRILGDREGSPLHERARLVTSVGWIVAVLFALTLKSRRNIEYLVPVLVLWCAAIWDLVDLKKIAAMLKRWQLAVLVFCIVLVVASQVQANWTSFHPPLFPDDVYRETMNEISKRAAPGDRVFNASWDEFPMLFALDDRLRYVSGVDPTFLYMTSPTISDRVRDVTCRECRKLSKDAAPWSVSTSTRDEAWSLIRDELGSRFIFVSKRIPPDFLDLVRSDPRYEQIADTKDSAAFEIRTSPAPSFARRGI